MNGRTTLVLLIVGLALLLNVPAAMAQQQYVFLQKGQSAEQQDYLKARGACLEGKGYSVK